MFFEHNNFLFLLISNEKLKINFSQKKNSFLISFTLLGWLHAIGTTDILLPFHLCQEREDSSFILALTSLTALATVLLFFLSPNERRKTTSFLNFFSFLSFSLKPKRPSEKSNGNFDSLSLFSLKNSHNLSENSHKCSCSNEPRRKGPNNNDGEHCSLLLYTLFSLLP